MAFSRMGNVPIGTNSELPSQDHTGDMFWSAIGARTSFGGESSFSSINHLVLFRKIKIDFEIMAKKFIIDKNPIDNYIINDLIEQWKTIYIYIDTFYPEKMKQNEVDIIDITKFNNFHNIMKKYDDIIHPRDEHGVPVLLSKAQLLTKFSGKPYEEVCNECYILLVSEIKHI